MLGQGEVESVVDGRPFNQANSAGRAVVKLLWRIGSQRRIVLEVCCKMLVGSEMGVFPGPIIEQRGSGPNWEVACG